MPIKRTVHADGSWTDTADDPKSTRELMDKHGPGLQKRGEEDFHRKWLRDSAIGFERVRDPAGNSTHVRADEVDKSLASGYSAVSNPRMVMPQVPWEKKPMEPGRHRFKFNRETGEMEEI